jgi:hypothetical protein
MCWRRQLIEFYVGGAKFVFDKHVDSLSFTTKVVFLTPSVFNLDCGLGRCFPEEHWLLFLDGQQP